MSLASLLVASLLARAGCAAVRADRPRSVRALGRGASRPAVDAPSRMCIEIDLAKNAAGAVTGALSSPQQHVKGLPLLNVAVDGAR